MDQSVAIVNFTDGLRIVALNYSQVPRQSGSVCDMLNGFSN
jgi:hypothetical protein